MAIKMWIFGYGSLMWDEWEKEFDGQRTEGARLVDYSRAFNKKSSRRWGTSSMPCPTLTLEPSPGSVCIGCAFEFPEERQGDVIEYLKDREGPSMELREVLVDVPAIGDVSALTALLRPTAITRLKDPMPEELADMVQRAKGTAGSCFEYFATLRGKLRELGVVDPAVESIANLVLADPGQLPLIPKDVLREHLFFYHVTSEDRWPRIKIEGLRPEHATQIGYSLTPLARAKFICLTTERYLCETTGMIMDKIDSTPAVVLRLKGEVLSTKRCTLDYSAHWIAPLLARGVPDRDLLTEAKYLVCLDPIAPWEFGLSSE